MRTAAATDDYAELCRGVRTLCGMDLGQYRRAQMERRVRTFAERRGATDLRAYLGLLRADVRELDALLDRVTINVSQLWRNPEQWRVLGTQVLPALAADGGRVRAWSAGCSYGAEAYTLAAVAADAVPGAAVSLRGTDIDRRMVERAILGRFDPADARTAPRDKLERFFDRDGDAWVATAALRSRVRFEVADLLRMRVAPASLDLVLCRNTVIYFTEDVRDALHARLADALRPGGVLVVGATERVSRPAALSLTAIHPCTYRKA